MEWKSLGSFTRAAGRVAIVLGAITGITVFFIAEARASATTITLTYLVAILAIAAAWGLVEATAASVVAVLCLNYFFLPSPGPAALLEPRVWVILFAFLATSLIASQLSGYAKGRAAQAMSQQGEMERLYALSCSILLTDSSEPVAKQFARQIAAAFEFPAVALYDRARNETFRAGRYDLEDVDKALRAAAVQGTQFRDDARRLVVSSIRLGGEPIGSLAFSGDPPSDAALQSLSNLIAVGLEKARAQDAATRADAARESQELRATLLDAIAHEFQTPLTSLKAATTALLSDPEHELHKYKEIVAIADQEVDRLARQLKEAIQAARIESGEIRLNRELYSAQALIAGALGPMKPLADGREITVQIGDHLPEVLVDAELVELALRQVVDNGLKYSPPGAPLAISAEAEEDRLIFSVADQGFGISETDHSRIFDKFYRGSRSRREVTGTGMGLAIAREILRVHGGDIGVKSQLGKGTVFSLWMPSAPAEKTR